MPSATAGKLGPPKGVCAGRGRERMWLLAKRTQGKGRKGGEGEKQPLWVEGYSLLALVVVAFLYIPLLDPYQHHNAFLIFNL